MSMRSFSLFRNKKVVIGVLHFMPLMGYKGYTGMEKIFSKAKKDLDALQNGGVNAVIFENNYDLPHKIKVGPETISSMSILCSELVKASHVPVGISVLWNDFEAALAIAKNIDAKFIRIPVFVDKVQTNYGVILGDSKAVHKYIKRIGAEGIMLFTDIHVKHAKILNKDSIEESALKAIKEGSDALIITGKWTADAPDIRELIRVRDVVGSFPILSGSGADVKNIKALLKYVDGVIVSTSLKEGKKEFGNVNIKNYRQKISPLKVKEFVEEARNYV